MAVANRRWMLWWQQIPLFFNLSTTTQSIFGGAGLADGRTDTPTPCRLFPTRRGTSDTFLIRWLRAIEAIALAPPRSSFQKRCVKDAMVSDPCWEIYSIKASSSTRSLDNVKTVVQFIKGCPSKRPSHFNELDLYLATAKLLQKSRVWFSKTGFIWHKGRMLAACLPAPTNLSSERQTAIWRHHSTCSVAE